MNTIRLAGVSFLAIVLTGCQTVPSGPGAFDQLNWEQRREYLSAHREYEARGRFGVTYQNQAEQGAFTISNAPAGYQLNLSGPLGLGAVEFKGDFEQVIMTSSRHGVVDITDPEQQLTEMLGFPVPLGAISFWAQGVPQPDLAYREELDPDISRLTALEQAGWRIEYQEYRRFGEFELPRKIDMTGPGVKMRMVFRSWQFPP